MSTMKQHRAIGIVDENGVVMTIMAVHESVSDVAVKSLIRLYTYEIVLRKAEAKIKEQQWLAVKDRCGKAMHEVAKQADEIHPVHRMNLLKKLVRMNPAMAGYVITSQLVVNAPLFDTKGWKKKDQRVLVNEYHRACGTGDNNVIRPIETEEEHAFYRTHDSDALNEMVNAVEKVYFIDVKKNVEDVEGNAVVSLMTYMEKMV